MQKIRILIQCGSTTVVRNAAIIDTAFAATMLIKVEETPNW